jgi:hypothetical protein
MLHITNGDAAAETIRRARVPGVVVAWRDVLHEGPVPEGLSFDELRAVRARFIADETEYAPVLESFAARDAALAASVDEDELVLWFEHDLYDQLQLLQVIDWLATHRSAGKRTLVCDDEYLGPSTPGRLAERFETRTPIAPTQIALAVTAWAAFRAATPAPLEDVLESDTSALPYLRAALRRHLQQYPSTVNGLSRSEHLALAVVDRGAVTVRDAFAASQAREEPIFLGDLTFATYLESLSRAHEPLVLHGDGRTVVAPRSSGDDGSFWNSALQLTDAGRAVLAGARDHVGINGIDRWLGGVHLSGTAVRWRWDEERARVVETDPRP